MNKIIFNQKPITVLPHDCVTHSLPSYPDEYILEVAALNTALSSIKFTFIPIARNVNGRDVR